MNGKNSSDYNKEIKAKKRSKKKKIKTISRHGLALTCVDIETKFNVMRPAKWWMNMRI